MNLETINKWLDNEYGVSYTRLEELHDFVVEQDLKHQEKAEKEIERLNNIINELEKEVIKEKERTYYDRDAYRFTAYEHILDKLQELKEK